jgi:hypothetical protein
MCGAPSSRVVSDTNYADFPSIIPPEGQSERCHLYSNEDCYSIPLLSEVLKIVPANVAVNIEFKQCSQVLVDQVRDLIRVNGLKDQVFWFSLDEKINKLLRSADPSLPTITSIPALLKVLFLYYFGVLPFVDLDDAIVGVTVEEVSWLDIS